MNTNEHETEPLSEPLAWPHFPFSILHSFTERSDEPLAWRIENGK
jgi:hypothetical protein